MSEVRVLTHNLKCTSAKTSSESFQAGAAFVIYDVRNRNEKDYYFITQNPPVPYLNSMRNFERLSLLCTYLSLFASLLTVSQRNATVRVRLQLPKLCPVLSRVFRKSVTPFHSAIENNTGSRPLRAFIQVE